MALALLTYFHILDSQISTNLESLHEDRHYEVIIKLLFSDGVAQLQEHFLSIRDKIDKLEFTHKQYLNIKKALKFNHDVLNTHGESLYQYL